MSKIFLEINNLKKSFDHINGRITLFESFNIRFKEGELVALVGPSGSGKSSLLHLLALLDDPSRGKIILNSKEIKNLTDNEKDELRRKNISIIFQDNNLLSDFTAIENVMMPLLIKGENEKKIKEKAEKILKDVKIINRSKHFPNELSGGEQQRVAIARSLINSPDIVFADEPTGNLDSENSQNLIKMIKKLNKEYNQTFVIVTHNKDFLKISDYSYTIKDGRIKLN